MNPNSASTMLTVRPAVPADVPTILAFITQLAVFEKCPEKVLATEDTLRKTLGLESEQSPSETDISSTALRDGQFAKCVIAQVDNQDAGVAVFFYNYSTVPFSSPFRRDNALITMQWLSAPGIYLEDLFVAPSHRSRG